MKRIKKLSLTTAEEEIMNILWKLKKGFVKDILEQFPEPKPAYNTVSTIIRILETKEFVGHKAYGKTHEYFPTVEKEEYTKAYLNNFLKNHFDNSFQGLVSFFAKTENFSIKELEETLSVIRKEQQNQQIE